jgi:cytidylate kinase
MAWSINARFATGSAAMMGTMNPDENAAAALVSARVRDKFDLEHGTARERGASPRPGREGIMKTDVGLDRCLAFINCQLAPAKPARKPAAQRMAVTISRQAGCGALVVAEKLAALLQAAAPKDAPPWTVFDRNLMEKVLEDHHLPARLARFIPEDRASKLQDIMHDLFGFKPPSDTLVQQTSETILHLAEMGHVILIGRAANVVTAKLPNVFHVRLVAPLEKRLEHACRFYHMSPEAAREFIQREDQGRERYLRTYFNARIDDPLLYHLVLNTGLLSFDEAARIIADAVKQRARTLEAQDAPSGGAAPAPKSLDTEARRV